MRSSRLNPELPLDAVEDAVKTALRPESQVAESENWRAYRLLVEGVPVDFRDNDGSIRSARARLVDFNDPDNNDYLAVNQFTVLGTRERRPDVVLFVNGLPLVLMELKRPGDENATLRGAFNQIQTYRAQIPDIFTWNQVTMISDGTQARAGSFTAGWEHFAPWKTIDGRDLAPSGWPQYEVLVQGMFQPAVLLDLVRNFVAMYGEGRRMAKLVAKYHQYWAVRKAVDCTVEAVEGDGRAGVVWHTQGSGKSLEMLFYTGKLTRHPAMENPTVVVLTDRNDLDDQLFDEVFADAKVGAPLPESPVQADSRDHLKQLLVAREGGGIIFSTIQKFGLSQADRDAGRAFPLLSDRVNIVVMVDEAHRSNYDFVDGFARHLRDALPNATYIGFTGTPIESVDRSTRQVFGDYIDIYDLTQAITDGATVKVYYEPRLAKVELPAEAHQALDDAFTDATSGTEDEARERLKTRWARVEAIVGSDKRIAELAADIVAHWEQRREVLAGKGMIVAMSRRIAVALYNEIVRLRPDWHSDDPEQGQIKVVITGSAADDALLQPHIYDAKTRRLLKNRAKDPGDPLELVIVRDMWLTGFDSPSMHTMYVDKPMRGAPLVQAIARVNRTFRDKPAGLVVDYLGIAEDLKSAPRGLHQARPGEPRTRPGPARTGHSGSARRARDRVHDPQRVPMAAGPRSGRRPSLLARRRRYRGLAPGLPPRTAGIAVHERRTLPEVPLHGPRAACHVPVHYVRARRGGTRDPRGCRLHRGHPRLDRQDRGSRPRGPRPGRRARRSHQAGRVRAHLRHRCHRHLRRGGNGAARPVVDRRGLYRQVPGKRPSEPADRDAQATALR